jgi:4-carboxymuconolactone decarboxylase
MARLSYQEPEGEVADRIRARRGGRLTDLDRMLLHNPAVADGWNSLLGAIRTGTALPGDLRELAILRVAVLNGAAYEWRAHERVGREAGLGDDVLQWLRTGAEPARLTRAQAAVDAFATELTRDCAVSDRTFAAALDALGETQVAELTATVAAYNMVSRFLTALDVGEAVSEPSDEPVDA